MLFAVERVGSDPIRAGVANCVRRGLAADVADFVCVLRSVGRPFD
jgi:hypothetical protein